MKQKSKKLIIGFMSEDLFKLRSKISDNSTPHTLLKSPGSEMKTKGFRKQFETSKIV